MFPRIEYLHWIRGRPERARFDFGSSGLRIEEGPIEDALADGDDPPEDASLKEGIADECGVDPDEVVVAAGATHANVLAAGAALSAGSGILVERPGYEPLVATPRGLGARIERFDRPANEDYPLDPDRIEAALSEEIALVTVTNRHNPSGRRTDPETLAEIVALAREYGAHTLVDEVYAPYGRSPPSDVGLGGGSVAGMEGVIATGSITKLLGLGGLRIGWLVADPAFAERAREVEAHLPVVAGSSRRLARRVLSDRDARIEAARERIARNAGALAEFAGDRDDLEGVVRRDCTFAFLSHERADGDEVTEAAWEEGILVVPGRFFGDPDRFRISVARDPETVEEGLEAFGDVLAAL